MVKKQNIIIGLNIQQRYFVLFCFDLFYYLVKSNSRYLGNGQLSSSTSNSSLST